MSNTKNAVMGAGAAATVMLPGAVGAVAPQLLQRMGGVMNGAAPVLSTALPGCSGVCGACGGGCLGGLLAIGWLGVCAAVGKEEKLDG